MATEDRTAKALSLVLPAGAFGASLLLALSSAHAVAALDPSADLAAEKSGVATRLKAIRAGVTDLYAQGNDESAQYEPGANGAVIPTWWANGGWGNGGWGPRPGGWGNGGPPNGWRNGGWGNGGWPNWHNATGWGNGGWPNGWHNYWQNG